MMNTPKKKFCLMTIGRTGSTSLMNAIVARADVVTPATVFSNCVDHELLHPDSWHKYARALGRLAEHPLSRPGELIRYFYRLEPARIIGFKSMPERHKGYDRLIRREDIQFITLTRGDVASTVASFMIARVKGTWRRDGGAQDNLWAFKEDNKKLVVSTLHYVLMSQRQLNSIPNAIRLDYEKLCDPDFKNARLDDFFETHIALDNPRPPTAASTYVTNWDEFESFIDRASKRWEEKRTSQSSNE